jgi:hypothetical protein
VRFSANDKRYDSARQNCSIHESYVCCAHKILYKS